MPKGAKIRAITLSDYRRPEEDEQYSALYTDDVRHMHIAITTVLFNPDDGLVYCGLTAGNSDLLYTYAPKAGEFDCCNYQKIAEPYEEKIHRSLVLLDGLIYGATAHLRVGVGQNRLEAPGGRLFTYDPKTGDYVTLCRPVKHDYIQSICIDEKRRVVYGNNHPLNFFWSYDLKTGEVADLGLANMPDGMFCDREGNTWGNHVQSRHLFKYNPDDGFTNFDTIPTLGSTPIGMSSLFQPDDEDTVYIGTSDGSLVAMDPRNAELTYLGKPTPYSRVHGIVKREDGLLYSVCGGKKGSGACAVFAYDREDKKFIVLGELRDEEKGIFDPVVPHCITLTDDGVIYTGETDHPDRAAYLWEIVIED